MSREAIRPLKSWDEFRACERLQQAVWGTVAASSELLGVTAKHGGVVLGALVDGKVVGFIYAFLARYKGELIHWSHMMAVEAACRDRGFGFRMKLKHREIALEQGVKAIGWTYDPLQSRNAALNIRRLGARISEYLPDCYGHFPSKIERGMESDRFVADWRVQSVAVERRLKTRNPGKGDPKSLTAPLVNHTEPDGHGFIANAAITLDQTASRLRVEIPTNTDLMREKALPLARRWRLEMRRAFQCYLAKGYRVDDFLPPSAATAGRCFYVLRRVSEFRH